MRAFFSCPEQAKHLRVSRQDSKDIRCNGCRGRTCVTIPLLGTTILWTVGTKTCGILHDKQYTSRASLQQALKSGHAHEAMHGTYFTQRTTPEEACNNPD